MPVISKFYGIVIKIYFMKKKHNPPHLHAIYGEYMSVINIETLEVIEGDLPEKALKLVKEWIIKNIIPKENLIIIAEFENGIKKEYDIKELLNKIEVFSILNNKDIFNNVVVDSGGYGISWSENIDLSSEEIWENGVEI